uniref:Uncharacterized protein, contains caspase domain n=1 Tax=Candidatus Kentrum sp. UNK TaxID=2126344 RepID=A0A451AJH0_9GAMM|nr:MAG: Uncharacterized protein, contains caspase domain [Candidatus Kentron sp. UNK]VFK71789.1 MAG: Uncharacterized protein, contains caspase domain [Candidatus Kentron sp. UNK]
MEKHALLIGVSQYSASDLSPLPAAVADVRALSGVLRHPEMGGFIDANVTLLEDPDRQAMETAIEELFSGRAKDDLALLYFSGHGLKDDAGRLYLATGSTRKKPNGELVRATAVSASAVHENMQRSRARRQVVILDSCYSGAFPAEYAIKDDGSIDIPSQFLPRAAPHGANMPGGEGRAILTASTATRYAFQQTDAALSLYTRFLIQGIETGEADGNDNGFVTVGELHEYARQRVQEEQPAMQPGIYLGGGGGAIRVAGTPVGDPSARYAKEVEKSLDHRGEIAIAAHPRLNDWRERLGLDTASYDAIERDAMAARRKEFHGKCQEYGQTVREILKQGKRLADEAEKTNLADYRQRLGLAEEDAQAIQAKVEKEVTAERERHEKSLERYAIFVRTAIGQEGASLSRETREQMARAPGDPGALPGSGDGNRGQGDPGRCAPGGGEGATPEIGTQEAGYGQSAGVFGWVARLRGRRIGHYLHRDRPGLVGIGAGLRANTHPCGLPGRCRGYWGLASAYGGHSTPATQGACGIPNQCNADDRRSG